MSEIIIYTGKNGEANIDVTLTQDSIWLTQQQIADLFGTKRQAISKHLGNIFATGELSAGSTCSKMEHVARNNKIYKTKFYSLDAIISVGYRVNSKQATLFRIWATNVLKKHLIQGYSLYEKRLTEQKIKALSDNLDLLQKTLTHNQLVTDIGTEVIQLIANYAKTWHLLFAYDKNQLISSKQQTSNLEQDEPLKYQTIKSAINTLKIDLHARGHATSIFGQEVENKLEGILGNIEQTFNGTNLYETSSEKAAHLLYFIIKDHPFVDGNKRIGCLSFLLYLQKQSITANLTDNGLAALALLVAESTPSQKDNIIRLIINLLNE